MPRKIDLMSNDSDAFTLEQLSLERSVWLPDEDAAAVAYDAVPRYSLAGRARGHCASGAARAPLQAQGSSERPIS